MKLETGGKRKQSSPRKSCEKCVKIDFARFGLSRKMQKIAKDGKPKLKQKLPTPACRDNGIKTEIVILLLLPFKR